MLDVHPKLAVVLVEQQTWEGDLQQTQLWGLENLLKLDQSISQMTGSSDNLAVIVWDFGDSEWKLYMMVVEEELLVKKEQGDKEEVALRKWN